MLARGLILWSMWTGEAVAAEVACGPPAPPVPSAPSRPATLDFAAPPNQLAPYDHARYYDDQGRFYTASDVEEFVWIYVHGPPLDRPTNVNDYYHGGYSCFLGSCTPADPVAYEEAAVWAEHFQKAMRAQRRERRAEPVGATLCRYNQARADERQAAKATATRATDLSAIRATHAPDLPLTAFVFSEDLGRELGLPAPPDASARVADARAVWGLVTRLGDPGAAAAQLRAARAANPAAPTLAALLPSVP